eukprot:SAG31_NODE_1779_length_7293_cov_39.850153_4_plen_460_part_00
MIISFPHGSARFGCEDYQNQLASIKLLPEYLPKESVAQLYLAADAFVLCSRGEGWGRPVAEAMAMGVPTLATNWSGQTDFLDQDTGTLFRSRFFPFSLFEAEIWTNIVRTQTGYPIPIAGLTCINGSDVMSKLYNGHRWAAASIPELRNLLRQMFNRRGKSDPEIAARAARGKQTVRARYNRQTVGAQVWSNLHTPEVERWLYKDSRTLAHSRTVAVVRDIYDAVLNRPPSSEEVEEASTLNLTNQSLQLFCWLCYKADGWEEWLSQRLRYGRQHVQKPKHCQFCRMKMRDGHGNNRHSTIKTEPKRKLLARSSGSSDKIGNGDAPTAQVPTTPSSSEGASRRMLWPVHRHHHHSSSSTARRNESFSGLTKESLQTDLLAFQTSWGKCWAENYRDVLIALPYNDYMPCGLRETMFARLKAMECANPGFNLRLGVNIFMAWPQLSMLSFAETDVFVDMAI